jgi:glycogen synthase
LEKEEGNGFTFETHNVNDYIWACKRALSCYKDKRKYLKLRENAFKSTMDGSRVSKAWLKEFFRLKDKVYVDEHVIRDTLNNLDIWAPKMY